MFTIKEQANNFKNAAERCDEMRPLPNGTVEWLPIPYCVNASFACELYLKFILDAEKIERGKTHYLNDLFYLLPNKIQDDVKKRVENDFKKMNENVGFETCLMKSGKMFVDWRYLHEKIAELKENENITGNIAFMKSLLNSLYYTVETKKGKT